MSKKKRELNDEEKAKVKLAKKELNEYRNDIKSVTEKLNDIEETQATLEKVTTVLSPTTGGRGGSNDKFSDGVSKLEDFKKMCSYKMGKVMEEKFVIDDKIARVPQPYSNILFYRYTRVKSWSDVSNELGYTKDYVTDELHPEALYLYSKLS